MKKFILLQGLLLASVVVLAQEPEKVQPPKSQQTDVKPTITGQSVEMKDGKVWLNKDGNITLLSSEINLGGSRVTPDGTVVLKDGKKVALKNGDKVTYDGVLVKSPDKMYTPDEKTPDNK
jgi:hypothetical protein